MRKINLTQWKVPMSEKHPEKATGPDSPKPLGTNPKDLLGLKKVPLSFIPPASLVYQGLAMWDGAKKYEPYNWRDNKVVAMIYIDACMRHIMAWVDGEENAQDSGVPHLGHALACLGILADAKETGNLVDNRPTAGVAAELLKRWERKTQ